MTSHHVPGPLEVSLDPQGYESAPEFGGDRHVEGERDTSSRRQRGGGSQFLKWKPGEIPFSNKVSLFFFI